MIDIANPSGVNRLPLSLPSQGGETARIPSLAAGRSWESHTSEGAHELKFVIDDALAATIREWARDRLLPDPHAGEEGYRVSTLYLDTPQFDVFRQTEIGRAGKYRVRRYGSEEIVWLERKSKIEGRVHKQRVSVPDGDIETAVRTPEGDGDWFRKHVEELQLRPVCQVTYDRFARIGQTPVGPVRMTLDSRLCGCSTSAWSVPHGALVTGELLDRRHVLELKFRTTVPALFKDLIQDLRLPIGRFSKYRGTVRRTRNEAAAFERPEK